VTFTRLDWTLDKASGLWMSPDGEHIIRKHRPERWSLHKKDDTLIADGFKTWRKAVNRSQAINTRKAKPL
jgi:hypothetical protein